MNVFKCFVTINLLLSIGCLSEKKASRIKNEAVNDFVKHNPCSNDTILFIGNSDSIILFDTVFVPAKEVNEPSSIPLQLAESSQKVKIQYITKTVRIRDTIHAVVRDLRKENLLNDSIVIKNKIIGDVQVNASEWESKARTRLWILIGIIALVTGAGGVYAYGKFKAGMFKGITM